MIVVDSPPGMTSPSSPSSSSGSRTSTTSAPSRSQHLRVLTESALQRENADAQRRSTTRILVSAPLGTFRRKVPTSRGLRAAPPPEASSPRSRPSAGRGPWNVREHLRVVEVRRRLDDRARAARDVLVQPSGSSSGSRPDLKIPEPTKTPSAPSCMQSEASAGVAIPPAVKVTTGSRPFSATQLHELVRRAVLLRRCVQLVRAQRLEAADRAEDGAHVRHRIHDVAGPCLALRPDHRGAFGDPPQRLAEVRRTADERHRERPLVHVVLDVGGRQDLGLVDVVDLELLEDLRLGEVADAALGHDRDGHGLLDLLDLLRIGHARDARRRGGCPPARARAP